MRSVMIPQLSYQYGVLGGAVDYPMLVIDAPGPVPGKTVFEGLGLAAACKGIAHYLMNKTVDAFEHVSVGLLPVKVVLPCMFGENKFHPASLRALPPPLSNSEMDSRRRLAFFGTRKR